MARISCKRALTIICHNRRWRSDSVVFADDDSVSAVETGVPVLGRGDLFEPVELADVFETLVDELPGTLAVRPDLTTVLSVAAARAVEQMFGAARDGANTAELAQYARAARRTFLRPDSSLL
jgi:hypothetical protein